MKKQKSYDVRRKILLSMICFLAALFVTGNRASAGSNEEALGFLYQTDPQQYLNLDGQNITKEQYEEIKQFTLGLTADAKNTEEKLRKIYKFVYDANPQHPEYQLRQDESLVHPYAMFSLMRGMCEGYANLVKTMCTAIEIPCVVTNGFVLYNEKDWDYHAWDAVWYQDKWVVVDSAMGRFGTQEVEQTWSKYEIYSFAQLLMEENGFQITYDEGLAIVGCTTGAKEIVIPKTCNDGKWTVTSVRLWSAPYSIGNVKAMIDLESGVEQIMIPDTVTNITKITGVNSVKFKKFLIDANNPVYSSYGGVLYNKDKSETLWIPQGIEVMGYTRAGAMSKNMVAGLKNLKVLKIEENVTVMEGWAIENCPQLSVIYLPDNLERIDENAITGCAENVTIYASEGSVGAEYAKKNQLNFVDIKAIAHADYSVIDEMLAKLPKDLTKYTEDSVQKLEAVAEQVIRGLAVTQQDVVNAMAAEIRQAAEGLTLKDGEKPDPEKPDPEKPDPEKPDPEKPDPEKPDPGKADPAVSVADAEGGVLPSMIYDGKVKKPVVQVKVNGKILCENADYTVSYQKNKEIGTASVIVKGIGSYCGEKTYTFSILPPKVTKVKVRDKEKQKVVLSWKKAKQASGYEIFRKDSKKWKKVKSVGKKAKVTLKKSAAGKTRYKVRMYKKVGGKKYYGSFSKVVKVKKK